VEYRDGTRGDTGVVRSMDGMRREGWSCGVIEVIFMPKPGGDAGGRG
jgi:hypothetical protein